MDGTKAYILSKKYTENSLVGGGAIKGKNAVVESVVKTDKQNDVTFKSTLDNGTVERKHMYVLDGEDGFSPIVTLTEVTGGVEISVEDEEGNIQTATVESGGDAVLSKKLTSNQNVAGIHSGDSWNKDTPLEKVLFDLLCPTQYPTLTNPSATISVSGSKVLETGSTVNKTFTVSFSRGSINPAYGTSGYRSGAAIDYTLNSGTAQAGNTFTQTVSESNKTFQAVVSYGAGEQPKDSNGDNYSTPLAAGTVSTNTITYEFTNCLWSNVANITTIAKEAIISKSTKVKQFNYPDTTEANPEVFDIPNSYVVSAVEVLNSLSGQWEDASDQFTTSSVSHDDAGGTSVSYTRYTCNLGMDLGSRSVRVKWN